MNASTLRRAAVASAVLLTAACADNPTAPAARHDRQPPTGLNFSLVGRAETKSGDTTVTEFTVDPTTSTTFQVGSAHAVYFPAHSICDVATSSYGPTEWDKPCTPMAVPLTITAKSWVDANGLPQVDFSPAMRFVPGTDDAVQLALAVDPATAPDKVSNLHIMYCHSLTEACIDEGAADESLATWVSPFNNAVYRRIKHFSGYNVSSGRMESGIDLGLSLMRVATPPSENVPNRTGHLMSSGRQ